ncbi:transposase [Rhizobium leguminosarum]|uniref:transposase n=1 Tax=Rhizobium leguminosarum TaxID=384 RepID=UPI001FDA428C|nr:transposase [Rhizobium leguminosarum]
MDGPEADIAGWSAEILGGAIALCLTLRIVYWLALRQTQGLMRSVAALMGLDIAVPDFSTLSRRSKGLALPSPSHNIRSGRSDCRHHRLEGLRRGRVAGNKHKTKAKRKRWCKLHGTVRNSVREAGSSLIEEPFAEDDGELGFGLEPFAGRTFPVFGRVVQN